jgi:WD40 repeat protein
MSLQLSVLGVAVAALLSGAGASDPAPGPVLLNGPFSVVTALTFSPDGKVLAAGGGDQLCVWTLASRQLRFAVGGHGGRVGAVAFSPDSKLVAVGAWGLKVWAAQSGKEVADLGRQEKG